MDRSFLLPLKRHRVFYETTKMLRTQKVYAGQPWRNPAPAKYRNVKSCCRPFPAQSSGLSKRPLKSGRLGSSHGLLLRGLFCAAATGHYLIAIIWRDPTATLSGFTKTHTLLTWEIHCASALFAKIAMPLLAQSLRRSAQANRHRLAREPAAAAAASGRRAASVSQGQVSAGQLPGAGSSILRGWPAGTIWTATTLASAAVSLTTLCTSPQPMSVKLSPAV
jgi:hypothetical protein